MSNLLPLVADGTLLLVLFVSTLVVLFYIRKRWWTLMPIMVMAGLTSLLAGKLLSLVYQPAVARPFMELGVSPGAAYIDNPGFPSDHALLATAAVLAVYMVSRNKLLVFSLAFLVVAMSVGRVLALVHTPIDVIGGIIAGLAGAPWYWKIDKIGK